MWINAIERVNPTQPNLTLLNSNEHLNWIQLLIISELFWIEWTLLSGEVKMILKACLQMNSAPRYEQTALINALLVD